MRKVIVRLRGGLGNQLFSYAAARRLAAANDAQLVVDDVTGFSADREYRRSYALDAFNISARKASPGERLEPFGRYRRRILKWASSRKRFEDRDYVEQEVIDLDERLLSLKVRRTVYLDGLWQSERYFKDIEETIREDLRLRPGHDRQNEQLASRIRGCNAVALHVRWFDAPQLGSPYNLTADYYERAITLIERKVDRPHYFVFSNDVAAARAMLRAPEGQLTFVSNNAPDDAGIADLALMTQCRHFITANSTYSWWAAWLGGGGREKVVATPDLKVQGKAAWGFSGLIPPEWNRV